MTVLRQADAAALNVNRNDGPSCREQRLTVPIATAVGTHAQHPTGACVANQSTALPPHEQNTGELEARTGVLGWIGTILLWLLINGGSTGALAWSSSWLGLGRNRQRLKRIPATSWCGLLHLLRCRQRRQSSFCRLQVGGVASRYAYARRYD